MGYTDRVKRSSIAVPVLLLAAACGGGDSLPTGPSPVTAEVEFRYVVAGGQPSAMAGYLSCAGQVRLYPSFWGFAQATMTSAGSDTWTARFEEVPVGHHSVRVEAPEACGKGDLFANGALLSDEGSASSFALHTDGSVTP